MKEYKLVSFNMPPEVHKALKMAAVDEGSSASSIVVKLVEGYLASRPRIVFRPKKDNCDEQRG